MKIKDSEIVRMREFVYPDSYAYVVRDKKTNKIIVSEWSEEKAEEKLKSLLNKK